MQIKMAVFDSKQYDKDFFREYNKQYNFEMKFFTENLTIDTVPLTKGYNVVCVFVNDTVDETVINKMYENGVKLLALRCAGYNNVEFKAAYEKIHIVRVPAYSPYAVAEHTIALMLGLNRKLCRAHNRTREANFSLNGLLGFDMNGKTVGVVGTGKIGIDVIKILKGFGMNIVSYDKFPNEELAKQYGFKYVELDDLFNQSDIITLHCPLVKETEHIINADAISKMKDNVMIINTGRGKLIDTEALINGLKNRKIGYAGLDVYEEESEYFFEDYSDKIITDDLLARLLSFNNVLVTSHQAFFTKEALDKIASTTFYNIEKFRNDEFLENEICYKCDNEVCRVQQGKKCF